MNRLRVRVFSAVAALAVALAALVPAGAQETGSPSFWFSGTRLIFERAIPLDGDVAVSMISRAKATELLGTMVGGYNVKPLIDLLDSADVAQEAANALKKTLLMFDFFHDVAEKAVAGNKFASEVIDSWSKAEWFTSRPEVASKITVTVFKVTGETNTDDLSPAPDAWSRPDIPLHSLAMGKTRFKSGLDTIAKFRKDGFQIAFVGDVEIGRAHV